MNILITGGCGFVGSNLAIFLKNEIKNSKIIVFDNLKRRGSELNLSRLKNCDITYIHGDVRNDEDFESIGDLDIIIDASAEPSVLAGVQHGGLKQLININLNGTINIINLALKRNAKLIFLSTSRVYPITHINNISVIENNTRFDINSVQILKGISTNGISEEFPLDGYRSIYGATKFCSELLINEYNQFLGLKSVINRCGVISGPYQMGKFDQGVTVLWLARHFWKKELSYIGYGGYGKQVRDVLHIDDLCELIKIQILNFEIFNGNYFNVGGGLNSSVSLLELTNLCQKITGNKIFIKNIQEDRNADIKLYITDNTKIKNLCGWVPNKTPFNIVNDIFEWVHTNEKILSEILN